MNKQELQTRLSNQRHLLLGAQKLLARGALLSTAGRARAVNDVAEVKDAIRETEKMIRLCDQLSANSNIGSNMGIHERRKSLTARLRTNGVSGQTCLRELQQLVDTTNDIPRIVKLTNRFVELAKDVKRCVVDVDDIIHVVWPMFERREDDNKHGCIFAACAFRILRTWIKTNDDLHMLFYGWWRQRKHEKWFSYPYEVYSKYEDSSNNEFTVVDESVGDWQPLVVHIVRALLGENGCDFVECAKFIREVIRVGNGVRWLTPAVIRTLLYVCESVHNATSVKVKNGTHGLSNVACGMIEMSMLLLETVLEVIVHDCDSAAECGLVDYIVKITVDPVFEMSSMHNVNKEQVLLVNDAVRNINSICVPVLLRLVEGKSTRKYVVRAGLVPYLLSAIIDGDTSGDADNGRTGIGALKSIKIRHLVNVIGCLLSTWNGIGLFLNNKKRYLRVLIEGLLNEKVSVKMTILVIISCSVGIQKMNVLVGGDGVYNELYEWEVENCVDIARSRKRELMSGRAFPEENGVVKNVHDCELLKMYLSCGLLERLVWNYENGMESENRWLSFVISEILYLKEYFGLENYGVRISFRLNRLVERETKKHYKLLKKVCEDEDVVNDDMLKDIIEIPREEEMIRAICGGDESKDVFNEPIDFSRLRNILKERDGNVIETLRSLVKSLVLTSNVLNTKEYEEWRWDIVLEIVKYYLLNDVIFEEIVKGSKFLKRLVSFYKPQKAGFIKVKYNSGGVFAVNKGDREWLYVEVGVELMRSLSRRVEGVRILRESLIVPSVMLSLEMFVEEGEGECDTEGEENKEDDDVNVDDYDDDDDHYERDVTHTQRKVRKSVDERGYEGEREGEGEAEDREDGIKEGLFGYKRLNCSLVWGYIKMVCVLSENAMGMRVLEEYGMIGLLFRVIDKFGSDNGVRGRDTGKDTGRNRNGNRSGGRSRGKGKLQTSMVKYVLENVSIRVGGQLRILMEKAVVIGNEEMKRIASEKIESAVARGADDYSLVAWKKRVLGNGGKFGGKNNKNNSSNYNNSGSLEMRMGEYTERYGYGIGCTVEMYYNIRSFQKGRVDEALSKKILDDSNDVVVDGSMNVNLNAAIKVLKDVAGARRKKGYGTHIEPVEVAGCLWYVAGAIACGGGSSGGEGVVFKIEEAIMADNKDYGYGYAYGNDFADYDDDYDDDGNDDDDKNLDKETDNHLGVAMDAETGLSGILSGVLEWSLSTRDPEWQVWACGVALRAVLAAAGGALGRLAASECEGGEGKGGATAEAEAEADAESGSWWMCGDFSSSISSSCCMGSRSASRSRSCSGEESGTGGGVEVGGVEEGDGDLEDAGGEDTCGGNGGGGGGAGEGDAGDAGDTRNQSLDEHGHSHGHGHGHGHGYVHGNGENRDVDPSRRGLFREGSAVVGVEKGRGRGRGRGREQEEEQDRPRDETAEMKAKSEAHRATSEARGRGGLSPATALRVVARGAVRGKSALHLLSRV